MATYAHLGLSGSTNGCGIKISATSSPGTTVHTAVSGTTNWDDVWLFATNEGTAPVAFSVEFGGTTSPDNTISGTLPAKCGLVPIVMGIPLQNGLVIKAFAGVTNVVVIYGYVNRITA